MLNFPPFRSVVIATFMLDASWINRATDTDDSSYILLG